MSILRDLLDMKEDTAREIKLNHRGSIAKQSNAGVLQFPTLVSSSISLEHATTTNKAIEREYVSFVAIMSSLESVTDEASIKSYMRKIHQNFGDDILAGINENTLFSFRDIEFIKDKPMLIASEAAGTSMIFESCGHNEESEFVTPYNELEEGAKKTAKKAIAKLKKEGNKIYNTSSNEKCVTVKNEVTNEYTQLFFVTDLSDKLVGIYESHLVLPDNFEEVSYRNYVLKENLQLLESYDNGLEMSVINDKFTPNKYSIIGGGEFGNKYRTVSEASDIVNAISKPGEFNQRARVTDDGTDNNIVKDVLRDNDVKKANELAPTLLHLKTYFRDDDDGLHAVDYMIGVKTVMHKVNSESMVNNLVKASKRGKAFLNIMKLSTGEMSFFKDFLFAIPRIKDDVISKYKDNPWFNTLRRRRKYAKVLAAVNAPQQLVPNTTIVISMDEVVKIKSEHGIDLMNVKTALNIMNQLFLLGFVVVDSSSEISYFLFDSRTNYEEYSFNALEKENSNSAKEIKNIMQVLGRM